MLFEVDYAKNYASIMYQCLHKERAPERSSIAELAGKKAGLNALPMNIAREANDQ